MKRITQSIYTLLKYKSRLLFISVLLTLSFGIWGYLSHPAVEGIRVLIQTFGLFAFTLIDQPNTPLLIAEFFATVTLFLGMGMLFFRDIIDQMFVTLLQKTPYTLLIGLGEQNSYFLEHLDKDADNVLIIESNSQHPQIEHFKSRGFGMIIAKAEETIPQLDLDTLKHCIISTGNDRRNIAIGLLLAQNVKGKQQKIFVRIEQRIWSVLFAQQVVAHHRHVDIITYSLYENMAKALFAKHSVLGLRPEVAQSNKRFQMVLVGDSPLATEIVYQLSMLSILPEQNPFTLHLVAPDATGFHKRLQTLYPHIEQIPHLTLHPIDTSYDPIDFYRHKVWNGRNLTNIILAESNEEQNFAIAVNLQNTTYLDKSSQNKLKTKILIALYHDLGLGKSVEENQGTFAHFHTFGHVDEACSPENLIDEKLDLIAKLIHNAYLGNQSIDKDLLHSKWMQLSMHQKNANKAQALHIQTKLATLGMNRYPSDKSLTALLKSNRQLFSALFPPENSSEDFPEICDTLLSKLSRAEHDRWSAFHYLQGWQYDEDISKAEREQQKRHPCLLPFEAFDTDALKDTYQWDVQAVLNIPTYLAHAGYEIRKVGEK